MQRTALLGTVALLALAALAVPATAAGETIKLTSAAAAPGDYTMTVEVTGFTLDPVSATPTNQAGHGHIHYFLNGAPCQTSCSGSASYATPDKSFTFHGVKAGDVLTAELANNDHSSLSPAQYVTAFVGSPVKLATAAAGTGTVAMAVQIDGLKLDAVSATPANKAGHGHVHYFLNGAPCQDTCAAGSSYATPDSTFTFHDVKAGDVLTAEVVNNDHSPFSPAQYVTLVSGGVPSLGSAAPKAGTFTMKVNAGGLKLDPVATTPVNKAGHGHIHYFLNGAPCQNACAGSQSYATDSTSFTFYGLKAGDKVSAELVNNDHSSFATAAKSEQTVAAASTSSKANSGAAKGAPGFAALDALAALAAVAVAAVAIARRKA